MARYRFEFTAEGVFEVTVEAVDQREAEAKAWTALEVRGKEAEWNITDWSDPDEDEADQ